MNDKPLTPTQCRVILAGYLIVATIGFVVLEFLK